MSNAIQDIYDKYCHTRFDLPSLTQIDQFADAFGVTLPDAYLRFLTQFNGGYFSDAPIRMDFPEVPQDSLTKLAGVGTNTDSAELGVGMWDPYWLDDNDPVQVLPIGYTTMGNQIFIIVDPSGDDYGNIGIKMKFSDQSFPAGDSIDEFFALLS